MNFATFADFLAMGRHGLYVWSAYGCCMVVLGWNLAVPLLGRRRLRARAAQQARRSAQP
jgi:heme exporter protein D